MMTDNVLLCVLYLLGAVSGAVSSTFDGDLIGPRARRAGHVIFRDDFRGPSLNTSNWKYERSMYGGYNGEIQVYTSDKANIFTRDGYLYIKPTLTVDSASFDEYKLQHGTMDVAALWGPCTQNGEKGCYRDANTDGFLPPVMSAKITCEHTVRYGRVDVRAKLPVGDWLWPGIWMLPRTNVYGNWPKSGDIDIMETRGNAVAMSPDGVNHGNNQVTSAMNWGPGGRQNGFNITKKELQSQTPWGSTFHIYSLDWTADYITLRVDDAVIMHAPTPAEGFWKYGNFPGHNIWSNGGHNAPFDIPLYLILNVAVGSTNGYFPDTWTYNTRKPWDNSSPESVVNKHFYDHRADWLPSWRGDDVAMVIDYVEMTQYD